QRSEVLDLQLAGTSDQSLLMLDRLRRSAFRDALEPEGGFCKMPDIGALLLRVLIPAGFFVGLHELRRLFMTRVRPRCRGRLRGLCCRPPFSAQADQSGCAYRNTRLEE